MNTDYFKTVRKKYIVQVEDFSIEVERKMIKSLRLSISGKDGHIHLSAPIFFTDNDIEKFIYSHIDWLKKGMLKLEQRILQNQIHYQTGDKILFLGIHYSLNVISYERPPKIEISDTTINLFCRKRFTEEMRGILIRNWYKCQLNVILPPLIVKWEKVLGVKSNGFLVNQAQTLWGSCNIRTHNIHFSVNLAKKPMRCVEYVVAHELTHILVRSHNQKFYSILDSHFEDAAELKNLLKRKD